MIDHKGRPTGRPGQDDMQRITHKDTVLILAIALLAACATDTVAARHYNCDGAYVGTVQVNPYAYGHTDYIATGAHDGRTYRVYGHGECGTIAIPEVR